MMVRIMIVALLIASGVFGWLVFKQKQQLDRLEAALEPNGDVERLVQNIQKKAYLYTQYNERKLNEGVRGNSEESIAGFVRGVAQSSDVLWGNVTVGKADHDNVRIGTKNYRDTSHRIEPRDKKKSFDRNQIGNFLYVLETQSQRLKVTEVDVQLADRRVDDHAVPEDRWGVEFVVTVRERAGDSSGRVHRGGHAQGIGSGARRIPEGTFGRPISMEARSAAPTTPQVSVLIPTYDRPGTAAALLEALAGQTLAPEHFEVIVVDDGTRPPLGIDPARYPFACTAIWQENAGPAAARNRALQLARAPLALILNDDAVPAPDLIERHLAAHVESAGRTAVLGTFRFDEASRQSPFVRVLDETDLLFAFSTLRSGHRYGWTHFWTCNLSVPTDALLSVGGFDSERFDRAICEDVELGYRLAQDGWTVLYREDCVAWHAHELTPSSYACRAFDLGVYQERFAQKHGVHELFFASTPLAAEVEAAEITRILDEAQPHAERAVRDLETWTREYDGRTLPTDVARSMERAIHTVIGPRRLAGAWYERTGETVRVSRSLSPSERNGPTLGEVRCRRTPDHVAMPSLEAPGLTRQDRY